MILHGVVIYIDYAYEIMGFACLLACWFFFFFFLFYWITHFLIMLQKEWRFIDP
jgi:hypothetical protein